MSDAIRGISSFINTIKGIDFTAKPKHNSQQINEALSGNVNNQELLLNEEIAALIDIEKMACLPE